jgi:hypothetical protein
MKLLKNLTIVFYFINLYLKESKIKEQQIEKKENVPLKAKTYSNEKINDFAFLFDFCSNKLDFSKKLIKIYKYSYFEFIKVFLFKDKLEVIR